MPPSQVRLAMRMFLGAMILECSTCHAKNRIPAAKMTARSHCGQCKTPLSPPGTPIGVSSAADFDELVRNAPLPVVVDFWAAWCGPCRMVAPELSKVADAKRGKALVAKVDTDALPEVAARFGIQSIPTMILFRDGREAKRVSGAMSAQNITTTLAL